MNGTARSTARVGSSLLSAALVAMLASPAALAAQTTVNFGDGSSFCSGFGANVSAAGLVTTNLRQALVSGNGTGGCAATNSGLTGTSVLSLMSGGTFSFISANFGAVFPTPSVANIVVTGFLGSNTVFSTALNNLPNSSPAGANTLFMNTNLGAVTRVEISGTGDPFFVDNFTFGPAQASVVPEPATVALMGTGLLGLVGGGWLRRRKAVA